jgi:hypothetical protein
VDWPEESFLKHNTQVLYVPHAIQRTATIRHARHGVESLGSAPLQILAMASAAQEVMVRRPFDASAMAKLLSIFVRHASGSPKRRAIFSLTALLLAGGDRTWPGCDALSPSWDDAPSTADIWLSMATNSDPLVIVTA